MIGNRILVPINFGTQSDTALKYAIKMASAVNGRITCLHVNEEPDFITRQLLTNEISNRIRRLAEDTLSAKANEMLNNNKKIPYEVIVTKGKVHRKVREKAKDLNVFFIVMAKSDSSDTEDYELGSNTLSVITKVHVPVLSVNNTKHIGYERILLPLDLSKPVEIKLLKALEFAKIFGMEVIVLSVMKSDWVSVKLKYQERLVEIQNFFNTEGVSCSAQLCVSEGSIPDLILQQAKKMNAGMIMMMTQQEHNITANFLGSTTHQIINQSEFPVLSIIPDVRTNYISDTSIRKDILNPISLFQIQ
jgi:nucleotide-binding universal stress UspA family protein